MLSSVHAGGSEAGAVVGVTSRTLLALVHHTRAIDLGRTSQEENTSTFGSKMTLFWFESPPQPVSVISAANETAYARIVETTILLSHYRAG